MKNQAFSRRFRFAAKGIAEAWRREASFRTQVACGALAIVALFALRPAPVWWALFVLMIAGVLSAELLNTALELIVDRLHPERHPLIGLAKDCAAGAVLVLSLSAVLVFVAMLADLYVE